MGAPLIAALLLARCATSTVSVESEVRKAEHEVTAAWLRHDTQSVARLFADDFVEITRGGRTLTKADILRAVASTDETDTKIDDERIRQIAPTVVVSTLRIIDSGVRQSTREPYTVETRVLNVWTFRDGRWQITASQAVYPPSPKSAP